MTDYTTARRILFDLPEPSEADPGDEQPCNLSESVQIIDTTERPAAAAFKLEG